MTETKIVERDMSVFTKQTMKNGLVKDKHGRRKLFAQYNETATATYDELHARPLNRVYQEREPIAHLRSFLRSSMVTGADQTSFGDRHH
jgi:hypothetical protein